MTTDSAEASVEPRATAVVFDPLTWRLDWSYDVEDRLLGARGVRLVVPEDAAASRAAIAGADVIVSSGLEDVDAGVIAALRNCAGILCYKVGMDAVDLEAAASAGIPVRNVNASTEDVADHALALLLAAQRRLPAMLAAAASGQWNLQRIPEVRAIRRLRGQMLGVIGAGRIGRIVARKARALGFRTVANDCLVPDQPDPDLPYLSLEDLLARCDAVVVCASLTSTSSGLLNHAALAHVRPGMILVNVARGALIDEYALADALTDGRIAVAALDVRHPEPPVPGGDPLAGCDNLIQTPHMAAASQESRSDLHLLAAQGILELLETARRIPPG